MIHRDKPNGERGSSYVALKLNLVSLSTLIEDLQHPLDLGASLAVKFRDLNDVAVVGQAFNKGLFLREWLAGCEIDNVAAHPDHRGATVLEPMPQKIDGQRGGDLGGLVGPGPDRG